MKRSLLSLYLLVQILSLLSASGISLAAQRTPKPKPGKQTKKPSVARIGLFKTQPSIKTDKAGIVFIMDVSGSMRVADKIVKEKQEVKQALQELKPEDTFNIIAMAGTAELLSPTMLPATPQNVQRARKYMDGLQLRDGTNISEALEKALSFKEARHIFLMTDGEPHGGIMEMGELRPFIKEQNTQKASIHTFGLVLAGSSMTLEYLKGIAQNNNGKFNLVKLPWKLPSSQ
jgi:Mg-chelatase subunit ChlD